MRSDVLCNHVNNAPGDPSVRREEFLEDALARTNLLRDGRIIKYDNRKCTNRSHKSKTIIYINQKYIPAYAKGNERERFSPITGIRYPLGKNHNSTNLEVETEDDTAWLKVPANQRDGKYSNNRRNDRGKFIKRSPSPYSKENKGKERSYPNSTYKGKNFDENYQAGKTKNTNPVPSTSKDKL